MNRICHSGVVSQQEQVGVGPWQGPWPTTQEQHPYDEELLAQGDRRNVVDRYRYWGTTRSWRDLDTRRHDFHVAIENWQHDLNIGSVVRTANAFLARPKSTSSADAAGTGAGRWSPTATSTSATTRPSTAFVSWARGRRRPADDRASTTCRARCRWRPPSCPRRVRAGLRPGGPGPVRGDPRAAVRGDARRSPSSAPRARSTPVPRRRSRCTPGSAGTSHPPG